MNRTELPGPYIDRLAELVRLHRRETVQARNAPQNLIWDLPGIKAAISETQDTGACALDICCIALNAAEDLAIRTPALMAGSGKHWSQTSTGKPRPRLCPHGKPVDTNQTAVNTSSLCDPCMNPPGFITAREAGLKDRWRAIRHSPELETERQERRTRTHGRTTP